MATSQAKKTVRGAHNPPGFAQALLVELGIKPTLGKVSFLNFWFSHEGNNSGGSNGQNNPLNVQGSNPVPYNYSSPAEGVKATASVLRQSNMSVFLRQLQQPNPSNLQLAAALTQTPWASSHYGATKQGNVWVGGSLVGAFTGKNNYSTWGNLLTSLPGGKGYGKGVTQEKNAVVNALTGPLSYILYGGAILGGVLLAITAFVLIGFDLRGSSGKAPAVAGLKLATLPKRKRQARDEAQYRSRSYRRPAREEDLSSRPKPVYSVPRKRIAKPKAGEPGSLKLAKGDSIPF